MSEEDANPLMKPAQELLANLTNHTLENFVGNAVSATLETAKQKLTPKGFMRRLCYRERK